MVYIKIYVCLLLCSNWMTFAMLYKAGLSKNIVPNETKIENNKQLKTNLTVNQFWKRIKEQESQKIIIDPTTVEECVVKTNQTITRLLEELEQAELQQRSKL